jgi:hypothetical protein
MVSFSRLTSVEQQQILTECRAVMGAPIRYGADIVSLCKLLAQIQAR